MKEHGCGINVVELACLDVNAVQFLEVDESLIGSWLVEKDK